METHELFFNRAGRLRSGWRLGIFTLLVVALLVLATSLVRIVYVLAWLAHSNATLGAYLEDVVFRILILTSALLAGLICNRWLEGLSWRALGLWFHPHWLRDLWVGSLIGIGSLALAALIAFAVGGVRFTISGREIYGGVLQTVFSTAFLFLIAALAEESLFRGYPLQTLSRAGLVWLAVLLTSVPFAIIHLQNPSATAFSSISLPRLRSWSGVVDRRQLWPRGRCCVHGRAHALDPVYLAHAIGLGNRRDEDANVAGEPRWSQKGVTRFSNRMIATLRTTRESARRQRAAGVLHVECHG